MSLRVQVLWGRVPHLSHTGCLLSPVLSCPALPYPKLAQPTHCPSPHGKALNLRLLTSPTYTHMLPGSPPAGLERGVRRGPPAADAAADQGKVRHAAPHEAELSWRHVAWAAGQGPGVCVKRCGAGGPGPGGMGLARRWGVRLRQGMAGVGCGAEGWHSGEEPTARLALMPVCAQGLKQVGSLVRCCKSVCEQLCWDEQQGSGTYVLWLACAMQWKCETFLITRRPRADGPDEWGMVHDRSRFELIGPGNAPSPSVCR